MRHLGSCVMKHVPVNIQDFRVYDRVNGLTVLERKWFLPFVPGPSNSSCIWLTVGIGGDSSREEKLAYNEYKFCKFYGIEALENNYGDYATFGTIIPHAVGTEDSIQMGTLIPCNVTGCAFKTQKLEIVAMHKLLDKYIGSRNIHFASFDIEGMEKKLIDGLMYNANITKNGITFCQIDWEIHPDLMYKWIEIKPNRIETVINLIKNSPYLPILISPVNDYFDYHHVTLLHVENPNCISPFRLNVMFNHRGLC
uniref:Methyltransferase FkbM domain-containing protein n=1 Tax=Acrobeloides nanus TaxID=290746 RepID=A0A914EB75_9BILA